MPAHKAATGQAKKNNNTNQRRGEQQSEDATSRQSSNGGSSKQRSRRSSSKSTSRNKRSRSSDGVERISAPAGWPFTSAGTNAKKKSSSSRSSSGGGCSNTATESDSTNNTKKNIGSKKLLEKSTKSCSSASKKPPAHEQIIGEDNVIQNKKGKRESMVQNNHSTTRLRTRNQKSQLGNAKTNESLTNDCGDLVEGDASLTSSPIIDGSVCSSNHNATDNKSHENECDKSEGNKMAVSIKQTATKLQPSTQSENNSNGKAATKTDWSCKRCTLLNTNRRKKCQACGTPRYLTVSTDGIFTLDEGKCQMNDASSAIAASASNPSPGQDASSSLLELNQQQQQPSQDGESGESQQSQLSAMIDAPVFTRSRRKVHLSQQIEIGMADDNEDEGNDNDNNNNDQQSQHDSSNLSLHEPKNNQDEDSGLRQWIQKRHANKREKRGRRKSVKNGSTSSALGDTKAVKVRVTVGEHDVMLHIENCESNVSVKFGGGGKYDLYKQQEFLEAIVPISVLSRIESQKNSPPSELDNERVEKQTHPNVYDERMERIQSPNEGCRMSSLPATEPVDDALNMQACDDDNLTSMEPFWSNSNGKVHYIMIHYCIS